MKNVTALKVKFLGATNTKPNRASITQTNNKKRMIWTPDSCSELTYSEQVNNLMEKISGNGSCFRVVDNTQSEVMEFVMVDTNPAFKDYIEMIKNS